MPLQKVSKRGDSEESSGSWRGGRSPFSTAYIQRWPSDRPSRQGPENSTGTYVGTCAFPPHHEEVQTSGKNERTDDRTTESSRGRAACRALPRRNIRMEISNGRCFPSDLGMKRVQRICAAISNETGRNKLLLDVEEIVGKLNQMLRGWANYFHLGPVSKAYRAVDQHTRKRLRRWLCAKHRVAWPGKNRLPTASFYEVFGLVSLTERTASFPWANRELSPSAGCGRSARPVR
jgi:Group II intron, maturase-specific domain